MPSGAAQTGRSQPRRHPCRGAQRLYPHGMISFTTNLAWAGKKDAPMSTVDRIQELAQHREFLADFVLGMDVEHYTDVEVGQMARLLDAWDQGPLGQELARLCASA